MVDLQVLPHEQKHLVVVGTSLRKPASIIAPYLQSLGWQVVPRNVEFVYLFVDDGLAPDARALVDAFVAERGGQVIPSGATPVGDFSDIGETHTWTDPAMLRVGANKDLILNAARENRAEAVWFVDSDLICDPMTFTSLWSIPTPIVAACYWTKWVKSAPEGAEVHAGPQVWLGHPYQLHGHGMEEWEFRRKLLNREIVKVFGQGACSLIRREALIRGVSFAPVPGNTGPGLMQGEDRHFCIRAELLHLEMVADGWPDIFHVYHRPEDEALIPEMLSRLQPRSNIGAPLPFRNSPVLGDLISVELHALEQIPTQFGPMHAPTQLVRGRLGKVGLQPELEQAVLTMERGETRIVPVHFGLDYPFPPYRGQRRLIRLTLIDHKPWGFPPVIEQEVIHNDIGSFIDTTTCPPSLLDDMREIHAA